MARAIKRWRVADHRLQSVPGGNRGRRISPRDPSVDGVWSHLAFSKDRNLNFPLLSDFDPKGAISRTYGVFAERNGESARALFVIDERGIIRWSYLSPDGVNPGADGILSALENLKSHD
ncbi:MAG: redoxin domain-containing protein [Methanobacteriota archaeon]|nr:MAG: redoxin domain-containing protein [Euryarchaeota archaeon]